MTSRFVTLKFAVSGRIARPVHEVFEAIADPGTLSKYFTTNGAIGRLASGSTVTWDFADFPGAFPVHVVEVLQDERIVLQWQAAVAGDDDKYDTTVTFDFAALDDGRTLLTITEEGWHDDEAGRRASYGNCEGWTGMLCALKIWLEHGINLREGFYK
jgi:uncharacterized protein YndB with AHSA1/START domain